jgi:hypothetical protein
MINKYNSFGLIRKLPFRLGKFRMSGIAFVILISSFGPYIFPNWGVRLDQLVIYLSFVLLLLIGKLSIPRNSLLLWTFSSLLILFFVPLLNLYEGRYLSLTLVLAQIENYLQVPVLLLIFITILHRLSLEDREGLFQKLTIALMYMLAANTIFSLYILLAPDSALIQIFTGDREGTSGSGKTVTELSISAGRLSGVFAQVVEGGFAYALGLFLWVFNYKGRDNIGWLHYALFMLILIGGILTLSKVFLVIGIPLFLFCAGAKKLISIVSVLLICIVSVTLINPSLIGIINEYQGLVYLFRLIDLDMLDFFTVYTSGRFSSESMIMVNIINTLNISPFIGLGYGSIETSDFSLNEVISLGGLVGLLAYLSLHVLIAVLIFKLKKGAKRTLYINFIVLTFLASISAPIITANRISVFICLIVAWAYCETHRNTYNFTRDSHRVVA